MSNFALSHPYFGAFVMLVLAPSIFFIILKLSNLVGKFLANRNTERLKSEIYECGPESVSQPNRINSHFFLIAALFVLFDVEIIFMFPWAINFKFLGVFGVIELGVFLALLILGFIYAWKKGALNWHSIK
jgi:NADH-quinone oxidoreductase subunit